MMEPLAKLTGTTHNMRRRAALVAAGTVLTMVSGIPLGLADEPAPTDSSQHPNVSSTDDSLTIFSTTIASHTTTNTWSINAQPDAHRVNVKPGEPAVVQQVVEVTHTGRTLSAFELRGTIIVANSADTPRDVTVGTLVPGTTCDVVNGTHRSVAPGSQIVLAFTCAAGTGFQPANSDVATAMVSWQHGGVAHTLDAADEPITWDGLYLHNTVDVHDIDGDELSVLGSLLVDTDGTLRLLTPESGTVDGTVARFTYQAQLGTPADSCKTWTSLGVVAGDDGEHVASDPASVTVCPRPITPGLPHTGN